MRPSSRCLLLLVLGSPTVAVAQSTRENWSLRLPYAATGVAMATHPTTGRPIRFGGSANGTSSPLLPPLWEWDGSTWLRHTSAPGPALRSGHSMATDERRHEVVLFGGNTTDRDTWTWDGVRWQAHLTPLLLTMRADAAMSCDAVRGRIVLFGGAGATALGDTWEWDGSQWHLCNPGAPPTARYGHRMVFDAARRKTLLFGGGTNPNNLHNDTWEWDGTYWTQRFPQTVPAARQLHAVGFDPARQRVVMFGGIHSTSSLGSADTWEWDGTDWARIAPAHLPPGQARHALFFDGARQRLTMFGAADGIDEVWDYDGVDWSPVVRASAPSPRVAAAICDDPSRGEAVLFGGTRSGPSYGDTWLWDGQRWLAAATGPAPGPMERHGHALGFDAARGVAVLFGGTTYTTGSPILYHDDTWTWNGTAWTQAQPAIRPAPRTGHGLAWHAPTSRLVLFSGRTNSTVYGDTWTWDGSNWTQVATTSAPPGRASAAMVGTGQDVLLFGGFAPASSTFTTLGDTWNWNGATWSQLQPATSPSPRYGSSCTYDQHRGRALLFGGANNTQAVGETWAFDGTNWSLVTTAAAPQARTGHVLVHDPRLHQVLLFGGRGNGQNDTWILAPAASQSPFGTGCPGALGTPDLQPAAHSLPEPGGTVVVAATHLPTSSAVLAMGFSNTTTGLQVLPLPLGAFGMPGCSLLVDPAATRLLLGTGNAATWTLALPFATGLFGIEFYCQAIAFDPAANAAGLTTSNAVHTRVGT